jgi:hypothetical protein
MRNNKLYLYGNNFEITVDVIQNKYNEEYYVMRARHVLPYYRAEGIFNKLKCTLIKAYSFDMVMDNNPINTVDTEIYQQKTKGNTPNIDLILKAKKIARVINGIQKMDEMHCGITFDIMPKYFSPY